MKSRIQINYHGDRRTRFSSLSGLSEASLPLHHILHRLARIHQEAGQQIDEIWVLENNGKLRMAYKYENPN